MENTSAIYECATSEIDLRRSLLQKVLDNAIKGKESHELIDEILIFFKEIFSGVISGETDLVVLIARKGWCLYQTFWPLLVADYDDKQRDIIQSNVTHDGMLVPWFNINKKKLADVKIVLADDSCQKGQAAAKRLRTLCGCYGIKSENISLYIFAYDKAEMEAGKQIKILSDNKLEFFFDGENHCSSSHYLVSYWAGRGMQKEPYKGIQSVRSLSRAFVSAYHTSSIPYLAFTPAFSMRNKTLNKFLLKGDMPCKPLTQKDLKGDFADEEAYEFYNITSPTMYENDVEAIVLFPNPKFVNDLIEQDNDFYFYAFRFYINKKLGITIFESYQSVPAIHKDTDIASMFPGEWSFVKWRHSEYEGRMVAYRLLSYSLSYLLGKRFLENGKYGLSKDDYEHRTTVGLVPTYFFEWLDKMETPNELNRAWTTYRLATISEPEFAEGDNVLFDQEFDFFFPEEEPPESYYLALASLFRKLSDKNLNGVPLKFLVNKLKERFDISSNKAMAAILMLIDAGESTVYVYERKNTIGSYVNHGELSCYAIYHAQPSYACYLQRLHTTNIPKLISNDPEYFQRTTTTVRNHFEGKMKAGIHLGLSISALMSAMRDLEENGNNKSQPYCALPYAKLFDSSEEFFLNLQLELVDIM